MILNDPALLKTQAFVGGAWIDADGGGTFDVVNPVDGLIVGSVADVGVAETRRAIEAAPLVGLNLLRGDRSRQRHGGDANRQRGDLRAGRAAVSVSD